MKLKLASRIITPSNGNADGDDLKRGFFRSLENSSRVRIVTVAPELVDYRREEDEDVMHQQGVARALLRLVVVDGKLGDHDPDGGNDRGESQHEAHEQEDLDAALAEDSAGIAGTAVEHFVGDGIDHEEADRGQDATNVVAKIPRLGMHRGRIDCDPPSGEEQQRRDQRGHNVPPGDIFNPVRLSDSVHDRHFDMGLQLPMGARVSP